jgi:ATP-dependent DNA helicase RecG
MELIEAVWTQIPDWRESFELPEGMFRRNVPNYDEVVIRELVSNALVHRPYSMRGDIFINLYPDRFEIHNPGLLPLGVTPANILHTSIKRNNHLAQVFYDLKLMEREGSGYDRIYEVLLTSGKPLPKVTEGMDRVTVSVEKRIVKPEILEFLHRADATFQLRQRELITLGLLAQYESLTAIELSVLLALPDDERLRSWLGRLIDLEVVSKSSGKTRALEYRIDSNILRELQYKGKTTLKRIESPRLQELILQDILIYQPCTLKETHQRIGPEISIAKVEKAFGDLIRSGSLAKISARRWTRYAIARNDGK